MTVIRIPEAFSDFDIFAFGTFLFAEGALGFVLNSIAALSFILVKEQRDPSNFLVFNLNIADLLLNINTLIGAYSSYLRVWPYGIEGCNLHAFQGTVGIYACISLLALVAWDKYHYWCTNQELYWATSGTMVVCVWVTAIFWAALPLPSFGWAEYGFEPMKTCCCLDNTKTEGGFVSYLLAISCVYFLIPLLIMHDSYSSIYAYFKKTHKFKFNTCIPEMVLLLSWGPYAAFCLYACVYDPLEFSPQFRMMLPVWAKTAPIWHAILYSFTNVAYKGGIWKLLTGQKIEKIKTS
ncbi:RPE-retinal G protein-coupled receptor-like [Engraulis encrasicolus]|uniref:RPE-retinal G protein-coupled receptor-like n=1 Tax=Engraulis encrasicolus TaxID=184585 RepID=UPI002FD053D5